jgi:hypothetical protein
MLLSSNSMLSSLNSYQKIFTSQEKVMEESMFHTYHGRLTSITFFLKLTQMKYSLT